MAVSANQNSALGRAGPSWVFPLISQNSIFWWDRSPLPFWNMDRTLKILPQLHLITRLHLKFSFLQENIDDSVHTFINRLDFSDKVPIDGTKMANIIKSCPMTYPDTKMTTSSSLGASCNQILNKSVKRFNIVIWKFFSHISIFKIFMNFWTRLAAKFFKSLVFICWKYTFYRISLSRIKIRFIFFDRPFSVEWPST